MRSRIPAASRLVLVMAVVLPLVLLGCGDHRSVSTTELQKSELTERLEAAVSALLARWEEPETFYVVMWAMDRGYDPLQLINAAAAGRLQSDGAIQAADGTAVPPTRAPAGLLQPIEGPTGSSSAGARAARRREGYNPGDVELVARHPSSGEILVAEETLSPSNARVLRKVLSPDPDERLDSYTMKVYFSQFVWLVLRGGLNDGFGPDPDDVQFGRGRGVEGEITPQTLETYEKRPLYERVTYVALELARRGYSEEQMLEGILLAQISAGPADYDEPCYSLRALDGRILRPANPPADPLHELECPPIPEDAPTSFGSLPTTTSEPLNERGENAGGAGNRPDTTSTLPEPPSGPVTYSGTGSVSVSVSSAVGTATADRNRLTVTLHPDGTASGTWDGRFPLTSITRRADGTDVLYDAGVTERSEEVVGTHANGHLTLYTASNDAPALEGKVTDERISIDWTRVFPGQGANGDTVIEYDFQLLR